MRRAQGAAEAAAATAAGRARLSERRSSRSAGLDNSATLLARQAAGKASGEQRPDQRTHLGHEPHGGPRRFDALRKPFVLRSRCRRSLRALHSAASECPGSWRGL